MPRFIQLHLLTSYPPSNLNRDDLGRPKTAMMGGAERLRISSQSLKRAWRKSELFESAVKGHIGTRTQKMGVDVLKRLQEKGVAEKNAIGWAKKIADVFGKLKAVKSKKATDKEDTTAPTEPNKAFEIEQLAHFSPEEQAAIMDLADTIAERNSGPTADELKLLRAKHSAVDIALFGRMLASAPAYNMEAAVQVAHAITVHKVAVEDDYFTAVDDLNKSEEDTGAAHLGETEFAAGLYYIYICIDRNLLAENLNEDDALVNKTLAALVECAAKIAPTGKQNSFASRAYTSFLLAEKGDQQPRSLSVAFLKPVEAFKNGMLENAIKALVDTRDNMNTVYGNCADDDRIMKVAKAKGHTFDDIIKFILE